MCKQERRLTCVDQLHVLVTPALLIAVPFGKIPLASMYTAAGALIAEQVVEKFGVF